jgi:DNA-binding NarL/FixJ family response regulator
VAPRSRTKAELFTDRESEVFELIVREGLSNPELARELGLSERGVKFHVGNVLRKAGTPDRLKLAVAYWLAFAQQGSKIRASRGARKRTR